MSQIDITTYTSVTAQIYVAFWIYFVCCVVASTTVFRSAVYRFFLSYSCLLPAYARFVGLFK